MPNKFYVYLLNFKPINLVFLNTYNFEFDDIFITFTDQNGKSLEVMTVEKVNQLI